MRKAFAVPALLSAALWSSAAFAEPSAEALRLYSAGEFIAAANLASAQSTPSDLIFVSSALLAACATRAPGHDLDAMLERASQTAQDALNLDPNSVEARIDLALAYGMIGKRATLSHAITQNYAGRGRHLIDEALAREPNNARAHALLGAWHFEVLRRGGGFGAMAYGARLSSGMAEFRRAQTLAPDDPLIPLQFAVALLQRDASRNALPVRGLLRDSLSAHAHDALETAAQNSARRLLAELQNGPDAAQRAAREMML